MLLSLLEKRRSIRKFKDQPLEREKIEILAEAAVRAPSSRGRTPWEFVFVTAPDDRLTLSRAREHGSAFLAEAPLVVAVCADSSKTDVWIEDCSIAATLLQLTAESLGLGSCWSQIRLREHDKSGRSAEDYVKDALGLPHDFMVEVLIGIGYPDESKAGHTRESLPFERVHYGSYGKK